MQLYHYTCQHGRDELGTHGVLLPASRLSELGRDLVPTGRYVWLTNLSVPIRNALGLTSGMLACDRIAYRYRVTDARGCLPWAMARRTFPADWRELIESAPGARPMQWFVSAEPVPVVLDVVSSAR